MNRRTIRTIHLIPLTFLLSVLLINPLRETAMEDDWAYALTVRHVLTSGEYRLHDWLVANMPFQAYWGALFASLGGYSFAMLRLSTLVLAAIGLVAFYHLAREHELAEPQGGCPYAGSVCQSARFALQLQLYDRCAFSGWFAALAVAVYPRPAAWRYCRNAAGIAGGYRHPAHSPVWGGTAGWSVCGVAATAANGCVNCHSLTLMVKSVQLLGAQAARLPQAGVWHRQTPT